MKKGLGDASDLITASTDAISMNRSEIETDLDRLAKPERLTPAELLPLLSEPFLMGWDDTWAFSERERADQLRVQAAVAVATQALNDKDPQSALSITQAAIAVDPRHEGLRTLAMKAHAALGSLSDALVEFRRFKRELNGSTAVVEEEAMAAAMPAWIEEPTHIEFPALPSPIDRFYGRDSLIQELRELLAEDRGSRLVSLVGPGGIGKTRLAIEVLKEVDGQVGFVSFVECPVDADPAGFLLEHFLQGHATAEPLEALRRHLRDQDCILVLDNLEHLAEPGGFVTELLNGLPSLRLIVTSRRPMKIAGERTVSIGPLERTLEALPMLEELVGTRKQNRDREAALAEIVDLCDGLPLSLRLAAARLRFLEPQELIQELQESASSLRADLPDLPERHRDLQRMLRVSLGSLGAEDSDALLHMSCYPGGVTRAIAKTFVRGNVDDVLERLLDSALVWLDDEMSPLRFRLLEPVRQCIQERANPAELEKARERFVDQMTAIAQTFVLGYDHAHNHERHVYRRETPNFRAAMNRALETGSPQAHVLFESLWHAELSAGRNAELVEMIRKLEKYPDITPLNKGHMLLCEAWCRSAEGKLDDTADLALQAKQAFDEGGDAGHSIYALSAHYEHLRYKSEWPVVLARYEEAIALAEVAAPCFVATLRVWRGLVRTYRGEWQEAESDLEYGIAETDDAEGTGLHAMAGTALLAVDFANKRYAKLQERLAQLRPLLQELGDAHYWSIFQRAEARFALVEGNYQAAEAHARRGLQIFAYAGNLLHDTEIKVSLARALIGQQRWQEAEAVIREMAPAVPQKLRRVGVMAAACLAEVRWHRGQTEQAVQIMASALAYRQTHDVSIPIMEQEYLDSVQARVGAVETVESFSDDDLYRLLLEG